MTLLLSFFPWKNIFSTFFFFHHKFPILHKKQKENLRNKNFFPLKKDLKKKKLKKFYRRFFTAVFFGGEKFLLKVKPYSNRPVSSQHRFKKSGGGYGETFFSYSA
jgi:hypothetical protein